jgi:hypothetical protein
MPDFEITLVAAEPQIAKPMHMAFDDRGRLWVTTTLEYPFPVPLDKKGKYSPSKAWVAADSGPLLYKTFQP